MSCEQIRVLLPSFISEELFDAEKEMVEHHLSECSSCRSTLNDIESISRQLATLQTVPVNTEITDSTLARFESESIFGKPRNWLRPVLLGTSAVIALFVLTAIFALPVRAPDDVVAEAISTMQELNSYRVIDIGFISQPVGSAWIQDYYYEVEYGSPDRFRYIQRTAGGFLPEFVHETIVIDNLMYSKGSWTTHTSQELQEKYQEVMPTREKTIESLTLLIDAKKLPDEDINGLLCFHYKGKVDIERFIEKRRIEWEQYYNTNLTDSQYLDRDTAIKQLENAWRTREITYEFWIGKSDYLIRQWTEIISPLPDVLEERPFESQMKETVKFYDFNKEIVIKPPLDSEGNLLPGWRLQSGQ